MGLRVHTVTVLKEFEPFGLTVEASDNGSNRKRNDGKYQYMLFDPQILRPRDDDSCLYADDCEHELFIRGKHLLWSSGPQVFKRFSAPSTIIKACWCHLESISEPLLCVLHLDSLTAYTPSGEMVSIPVPPATASIWPVPFGLLLQKAADANHLCTSGTSAAFPSMPSTQELGRIIREGSGTPVNNFFSPNFQWPNYDCGANFSHYILKHTLEEPQVLLFEERGKASAMNDPEEQILWTSETVPYIVSYHRANMRHSVWYLKMSGSKVETMSVVSIQSQVYAEEQTNVLSLHRIWQDKCVQPIANQVFLATDDDGVPLICFMLKEKRSLISLRLPDVLSEKIDVSWSIPAVAAAPVIITRPRQRRWGIDGFDLLILTPDGDLSLYVGRHCLCQYILPPVVVKDVAMQDISLNQRHNAISVEVPEEKVEIVGLSDAIRGRLNLITASGQVLRCALRAAPVSMITEDCINALAEGLNPPLFKYFRKSLWSHECSMPLSGLDLKFDAEWETFSSLIMEWIRNFSSVHLKQEEVNTSSAWEFLLCSKMHRNYLKTPCFIGLSLPSVLKPSAHSSQPELVSNAVQTEDPSFHKQILREMLDILHAVYEDYKLDILRSQDLQRLVHLVYSIAACLGEANFVDYYARDFPGLLPHFPVLSTTDGLRNPPNLLQWLQNCLKYGCSSRDGEGLPHLLCKEGNFAVDWSRKVVAFYGLLLGLERRGQHLASGVSFNVASGTANCPEHWTVLSMVAESFGLQQLDRLPYGVSLPLRHALDRCRESLPVDWPAPAYVLVGREDLALTTMGRSTSVKAPHKVESVSNHLNLLYMSSPYTLHLHPLIVPSSTTNLHEAVGPGMERVDSVPDSIIDGMEHMFNTNTQLRFGRDLRLVEVRRLLCSATPVVIHSAHGPIDEDQQGHLWHLTPRTTALPFGRGAFTLASTWTLLTEAMTIPALDVSGRVAVMNNSIVHLNITTGTVGDLISWPEFHNGVAAGLKIAPHQAKMSRTWIQYNKPEEPNFSHAGFLMALGLHGHLRVLARSDVYEYLTQTHEATMIGTMLGLAASHRGTMHPTISKMLYVHIPSRHPPSFPELELPTHVQSAAIMAVGLLYQESTHPMTMKILLDEIGRRSGGGNVLERERYAIAAGFAFGLVTLGRGNDASGFAEPMVDRLFQYMSGCSEPQNESYAMEYVLDPASGNQVMDGLMVNIDVTAPAATVALALMYLKTECEVVASRLSIPDTHYSLQFVRPDFILLRVIARNMILWERINPGETWIQGQIPDIIKEGVRIMVDNSDDISDNIDMEALVQSFANIVCGACFSIGLRYAGTGNADAQELLYSYSIYFLNEIKPVASSNWGRHPKGLSKYVERATLETCLSVVVLSLSLVMAGTGHLPTFRLLRYLHSRIDAHGHIKFGNHMAVSMAIGFLFLGGGMRTFATNKGAIAALLISLYPVFPTKPTDNNTHLQAFRHLYVLATEARCVQAVDVDTGRDVYVPLEITIKETNHHVETTYCRVTPCILPERSILKRVKVCGPRYWPQDIELSPTDDPWWVPRDKDSPFNGGTLYVKRKVGVCSYNDDPTGCQSLLSRVMHKVSDGSKKLSSGTSLGKSCGSGLSKVDQLVSTFSADPSLLAFAQLCCDSAWKYGTENDFQEFCVQVLFECVSTDRPALLQTYLYLYTTVASLAECALSQHTMCNDTLALSSLKVAVAYSGALVDGKLQSVSGELIQSTFLAALAKRVEDILNYWQHRRMDGANYCNDLVNYLTNGKWPPSAELYQSDLLANMFLSFYLRWYDMPPASVVNSAMKRLESFPRAFVSLKHNPRMPLLALMLPGTHSRALALVDESYPCRS